MAGSLAPGKNWFQLPFAISVNTPSRAWLMSVMIRFGTEGSAETVGVEIQRSARFEFDGSTHKYISCGFADGM